MAAPRARRAFPQLGVHGAGLGDQRRGGLGGLRHGDGGHAGLEDAGLVPGDLAQAIAQDSHVVVADRADQRDQRREHVHGVVAPAQADLHHRQLHAALGEPAQGQQQADVEGGGRAVGRRVESVEDGARARYQIDQLALRDRPAVHLDALAVGAEVRRGEQPGAQPGGAGDRLDHRGGAALALGAGHHHRAQIGLRVSRGGQQGAHAGEVAQRRLGAAGRLARRVEKAVDVVQGRLVARHGAILP
jgi:hypothetical protein